MSTSVLSSSKLRLVSFGVAGTLLGSLIFPSVSVLADSLSAHTATPNTSSSTTTQAPPSTLPTSGTASVTGIATTDHSTDVSAGDVATTLSHDSGVLASADQSNITSDNTTAMKAVTAGASVEVPKNPKSGVTLGEQDNQALNIQLPNADSSQDATKVANGTVAYPSDNGSASAVQAIADGGVRMLTVIDTPNAPTIYNYKISVPDGGKIGLLPSGGAIVVDGKGNLVAAIDAPWAHDATGKVIKTYFTTNGMTLTQHIEHHVPGVVYPVTADPQVSFGWYIYVKLSPDDQRFLVYSAAGASAALCAMITWGSAAVWCGAGLAVVGSWLAVYYNPRYWVQVKFTYGFRLAGWSRI